MARYNEWMNVKLHAAASTVPHAELAADRRAFFGSVLGALNHLVIADTIWLNRFASHPTCPPDINSNLPPPTKIELDALPFPDLTSLGARRVELDLSIIDWTGPLTDSDLDHVLHYTNSRGESSHRSFFGLLMHLFNHQTHHRGQVTTLLTQARVNVGATDLLV